MSYEQLVENLEGENAQKEAQTTKKGNVSLNEQKLQALEDEISVSLQSVDL